MNWKKERLSSFKLYAVTDLKSEDSGTLSKIEAALKGGVDIIQLRSKNLSDRYLFELGKKIRRVTLKLRKLFIVNDRVDLMLSLDADGVHLGQDDLPIEMARRLISNPGKLIGLSTHSPAQALKAAKDGADYIGFGPIFETPTKPDYQPIGLTDLKAVTARIKIPVVTIGGINQENLKQVLAAGAKRVAVVRGIFSAENPEQAARQFKKEIEKDKT